MIGEERIGRIHAALPMRSLEELRDCIDARVRRAIAKEREACATVVERWHEPPWHCNTCGGEEIAAAIRARGEA